MRRIIISFRWFKNLKKEQEERRSLKKNTKLPFSDEDEEEEEEKEQARLFV